MVIENRISVEFDAVQARTARLLCGHASLLKIIERTKSRIILFQSRN